MTAAIGVLCARSRVEEKQLFAALADAGAPAMPLSPTCPLPFTPTPPIPPSPASQAGRLITTDTNVVPVILDRCQDRTLAGAILPVWQALGATVLGAGIAATGNRATIAATLAAAGLPRPVSFLATDDDGAMATLWGLGYPATLLPLATDGPAVILHDQDTAEAVFEHRAVLGGLAERIALVQANVPDPADLATVLVVGGEAVAATDLAWVSAEPDTLPLAEATSRALGAAVIGVTVARIDGEIVVWDAQPVPEFRAMAALGERSAAGAIAALAAAHFGCNGISDAIPVEIVAVQSGASHWREVAGGVALIA